MELASPETTKRFLSTLWFQWGVTLVKMIAAQHSLNEQQYEALCDMLLKPNDWVVEVSE